MRSQFATTSWTQVLAARDAPSSESRQALELLCRYPDLWNLDLRLAKSFRIGKAALVLSAETFNVFNSGVELTRNRDAGSSAFNRLDEILNPRIARFGLRVTF